MRRLFEFGGYAAPSGLCLALLVYPGSLVVCRPTDDLALARPHEKDSSRRIDARYGGRRNTVAATGGPAARGDDDAHSFVVDALDLADGPVPRIDSGPDQVLT